MPRFCRRHSFSTRCLPSKAFSWTAVMMDLENVLPSGVQVLNIDPVISSKDGKVTIRLRVSGAHDQGGVDLVRNLEHSRRFLAPRLARETAENQSEWRPADRASKRHLECELRPAGGVQPAA